LPEPGCEVGRVGVKKGDGISCGIKALQTIGSALRLALLHSAYDVCKSVAYTTCDICQNARCLDERPA